MRSQFMYTGVALLLAPGLARNPNCEAPARDQVLLQGKAALQRSLSREGDPQQEHFVDEARKDLKGEEKKAERRRHLDSVMEQASELVRRKASAETMRSAGEEMEVIDERVLPDIMAEHKSASLTLELQWGMYELSGNMVEEQAKSVVAASERARKHEAVHHECREKEAGLLELAEKCEKELQALTEAVAHSHIGPHPMGAQAAAAQQHGKDVTREHTQKTHCDILNAERKMQRSHCDSDQHMSEQEWCMAHSQAAYVRGKLVDGYSMALYAYESAAANARAEEADRKKEFGVVEAVRCLKEHFFAAAQGSFADLAWLHECDKAKSESDTSSLDMTYQEPHAATSAAVTIKPEETPCTPEFVRARHAGLPESVQPAPCGKCASPSETPSSASSPGHGGHSDKFWFGFHQGVRAAAGHSKPSSAHVETFKTRMAAEGAEKNLVRFQAGMAEKVLRQLPVDWAGHLDQDLNHGFMNGFEAGKEVDAEEDKKRWQEAHDGDEEKIDKSLARATEALDKALDMAKAAHSKVDDLETTVQASSGFSKASEDVKVLPFGEI